MAVRQSLADITAVVELAIDHVNVPVEDKRPFVKAASVSLSVSATRQRKDRGQSAQQIEAVSPCLPQSIIIC
jgi:hypothetical protein